MPPPDDLDKIAAQGDERAPGGPAAADPAPGGAPASPQPPQGAPAPALGALTAEELAEAGKWSQLPRLFASIVCEPLPELRPVYSAQFCDAWGKSMLPLCRRYGWSFDTSLGPWAGVAMLTLAAAIPTGKAVLARRAAAQAKEATPPGKGTVTDGEPSRQAGSTVTDTGAAGQGARSVTDTAGVMV